MGHDSVELVDQPLIDDGSVVNPTKNLLDGEEGRLSSLTQFERKGTIFSTAFTLTCTMVGGGILSLPYGFKSCGLGLGIIVLVFMGITSTYSAILLSKAGRTANKNSLGKLADHIYGPKASKAICFLLVILLQFSHVGYLVLLGDLTPPILQHFYPDSGFVTSRAFIVFLMLLIVIPISSLGKLTALRFSSFIGITCISVISATIVYRCFSPFESDRTIPWDNVVWFRSGSGIFLTLSLLSVSFLCHFSILPLYNELSDASVRRMTKSIIMTMTTSGILFLTVAFFGYLSFLDDVDGNILKNFKPNDVIIDIGRIFLSCCLMMALPLLTLPERMFLTEMINKKNWNDHFYVRIIFSFIVYSISYGISILLPKISVVWSFFGSTIGVTLNYIIPGLFYFKVSTKYKWTHCHRIASFLVMLLGIVLIPVCIYSSIMDIL